MHVRDARPEDIPDIVRMRGHLWDSFLETMTVAQFPDWPDRAASVLADLLQRDTHRFLVAADDEGRVVGVVSGLLELRMPGPAWSGVVAQANDMWVEPEARGQGVARALMDEIVAWARHSGAGKIKLHSTPMAVRAYESMGFHVGEPQPGDELFPEMWMDFPA